MKNIELLEEIARNGKKYTDEGINQTFGQAYFSTQRAGNEELNFSDVIWEYDIEGIIENLKRFEIKEFTISSTFSSLLETLSEFEKQGCRMGSLTTVNAEYNDWSTGKKKVIPAIRVTVG